MDKQFTARGSLSIGGTGASASPPNPKLYFISQDSTDMKL